VTRLEVQDLNVWFDLGGGRRLHPVRGVSLGLDEHERLGLVGESGSGKTTAMLAIMGLLPSTATISGRVLLDGQDLLPQGEKGMRAYRWKEVSIVFQGSMNAFNPVKTIGAQIVEPMEHHGTATGRAARTRSRELLERVGMAASAVDRYPHQLSGGMRQRAAIAMALACKPKVLLADEPTTALDVMVQAQILDLLVSLSRDAGLSLILVTHDLPLVAETCGRAAVMYAGQVVESGPVEALHRSPRHPYTRLLLAATPSVDGEGAVVSIPGTSPRLDRTVIGCTFRPRCDKAFERCLREAPQPTAVGPERTAACHLEEDSRRDRPGDPATGHVATSVPMVEGPPRPVPADPPLLEVRGLKVSYPMRAGIFQILRRASRPRVRAVDGVSLTVSRGEMVALIGESGCGKTTTAMGLLQLVDGTSGSVLLNGQDISGLSFRALRPLRRDMQIIYQDPYEALDPRFSVRATVEEPLLVHRTRGAPADRLELVRDALSRSGLTPPELYLHRYPHQLSGGERQRVAIAASLVLRPQLLVADEPVSMLDVSVRAGILRLLDDLRRRSDLGILMITHDLSTAAHFADRIAVMYLGRIVEEGPAREVMRNPQHPYTAALLSVVPRADPADVRPRIVLRGEMPDAVHVPKGCRFHPRCPSAVASCLETEPVLHAVRSGPEAHRAACVLV